jgi:hypothetical protein
MIHETPSSPGDHPLGQNTNEETPSAVPLWRWLSRLGHWSATEQLAIACLACIALNSLLVTSWLAASDTLGVIVYGIAFAAIFLRLKRRFGRRSPGIQSQGPNKIR